MFKGPEFIRQLKQEVFETGYEPVLNPGPVYVSELSVKFFVDGERIIYCSERIIHGCKTT